MKIALYNLTTTIKSGGVETFNWGMARRLAMRGHDVHVYGGNGNIRQALPGNASVFTFPFLPRNLVPNLGSRFRKFAERLSFAIFSLPALVRGDYDIIYIHKPYDMPAALLASLFSDALTVFSSHGTEFFPWYKFLIKRIQFLFSCSEFNAGQVENYCGIRPSVLPNGIDTGLFRPLAPDSALKKRLGINGTETVLFSACRLVGLKGIRYAIEAAAVMSRKYPIAYLVIGEGEERSSLEALAKKLGIGGKVIFLGRIDNDQLPRYYSIADIAVFPSVADEAFGISIAEAMACEVPVISTRVGGIPEVVPEGKGILVLPKDTQELADALEQLICVPSLRKELGNAGRKWVVEQFGWNAVVDKFERYLRACPRPEDTGNFCK